MKSIIATTSAILAIGSLGACAGVSEMGARNVPDEFRVVTKAPLTVPPEYALRPPAAGEVTPQEVDAQSDRNLTFAFGSDVGANASEIEKRAVREANAIATNPRIRAIVDYETGKILRKPAGIADSVLSNEDTGAAEAGDSATGGGDVIIDRTGSGRIKLPGT